MNRNALLENSVSNRRVHSHNQFPSRLIFLRSRSTLRSTYFLLQDYNRKPDVHTCRNHLLPFHYSLFLFLLCSHRRTAKPDRQDLTACGAR